MAEMRRAMDLPRPLVIENECRLAGVLAGALWIASVAANLPAIALPGVTGWRDWAFIGIGAFATVFGVVALSLGGRGRLPSWFFHVGVGGGIVAIAAVWAIAGGVRAPTGVTLSIAVLFACYFFPKGPAFAYTALAIAGEWSPLIYDDAATHLEFVIISVTATMLFALMAGILVPSRALMLHQRLEAGHAQALRSAASTMTAAVVGGETAEAVYGLAAREAAAQVDGAAVVVRLRSGDTGTIIGAWGVRDPARHGVGQTIPFETELNIPEVTRSGNAVLYEAPGASQRLRSLGWPVAICAPIEVAGEPWGMIFATTEDRAAGRTGAVERVAAFADALATIVETLEDRTELVRLASTDNLTGLANHGTLHAVLMEAIQDAIATRTPLAVALLDIDFFKDINDSGGHEFGDSVLIRVADALRTGAREGDLLARYGGDEFAWVMPGATAHEACRRADDVRLSLALGIEGGPILGISGGVCDTAHATTAVEMLRLADGALYWSKASGRNRTQIYDPQIVSDLSATERAERLERSAALVGLRVLARAVDAKDPATREHSERVAQFVRRLACAVGWREDRVNLLHEAALVHDVGKLGVPDAILTKPGRLTPDERIIMQEHVELSARIVESVLNDEQVEWIRDHHERPDGTGYPRGLREYEIPEGAALIALADAWDVIVLGRAYSDPRSMEDAYQECISLVGRQFTSTAVEALIALHAAGTLAEPLAANGV